MDSNEDYVTKRSGKKEVISFDKILNRIKKLGKNELEVNYTSLTVKIIDRLYPNIPTSMIDELTAQQCASLATKHPDYGILASRVLISNHQKNTDQNFFKITRQLFQFKDVNDKPSPLISKKYFNVIKQNKTIIQGWFDYDRDFLLDYFGFKTLERAYLMKINKKIVERPQHMWMRVSVGIHGNDLKRVKETYDFLSQKYFTHATPTLFNAGTPRSQLSSCYLISMEDDSIAGIYSTLTDCALISKWAGGIGLHIHNVRSAGSHIRGTNGTSNGIVPMLRVFNGTARYCDQGGGKRKGSFAIYMEPWHGDIEDFLDMKKNHGDEEMRARDLFYALWIPDLFMKRVLEDKKWTLMCPDKCPGLSDVYGDNFVKLYEKYEKEGRGNKVVDARKIWLKILDSQIETGTPYMLYKDHCNHKSNQKNLGTIKSSNLCCEIVEYSSPKETAVCNLASIGLSKFIDPPKPSYYKYDNIKVYSKTNCKWCKKTKELFDNNGFEYEEINIDDDDKRKDFYNSVNNNEKLDNEHKINSVPQIYLNNKRIGGYNEIVDILKPTFNYELLHKITKIVTYNLNKVIDINFYPTPKTKLSNKRNRPIGIGVQGLADTFALMDLPFNSAESKQINKNIFETIYHAALESSMEISIEDGSYDSFEGSPASKGILQFDMWDVKPSDRYNWKSLKQKIKKYGLRNSLLVAPMPTASTSQILGNNECFEPFTSNIYVRRTLAGEFVMINKYLIRELIEINKWNDDVKNAIIKNNGSIQNIEQLSEKIKEKYKTVWEIPMKDIIDMSADRGAFICQSQSLNLWMKEPTYNKLTSMHMYSWKKGLKTGLYYLRTKAKAAPQQFTIEPDKNKNTIIEDDEICDMCSG
jgi:ribonucleoside-diphosphate reductase alpha subunit